MDFIDELTHLSNRIKRDKDLIQTEEATKTAFVLPFIGILEYEIFNPAEVEPEFTADVADLKGEKVDYAIYKGDQQVIMLIECKKCGEDLSKIDYWKQLARYFAHVDAQFAVLTDGILYQFYTHLEKEHVLDKKPFLEFNMLDIQEPLVNELKRFTKSKFDSEHIIEIAEILQYKNGIKEFMEKQLKAPSEDFVKYVLSSIYKGARTGSVVKRFTGIIKDALDEFLEERIQQRLKVAAIKEEEPAEPPDEDKESDEDAPEVLQGIEIIPDELEGFGIITVILSDVVAPQRIVHQDFKGFMSVRLDGDPKKQICRFYFNTSIKKLGIFDEEGNMEKVKLEEIPDIHNYAEHLKATTQRYDTPLPSESSDSPSESPE